MGTTAFAILGGKAALGKQASTVSAILEFIRHGLPHRSLESAVAHCGVTQSEITQVLQIPKRTLLRRKKEDRLLPAESDRLYRLARVVAHAV